MIGDASGSLFKISTITFKEGRKPTGLILASPILLLQEGQRTIKIKLHFNVNTAVNSGSSTEPANTESANTEPSNTGEGLQRSNVIGGLSNAFIATAFGKDDWLSLNNIVTTYDALTQTIVCVRLTYIDLDLS